MLTAVCKRRELAVGVEDVELAGVLAEVGSGVFRCPRPSDRASRCIDSAARPVIGEIAANANGAVGVGEERDQIRTLHLFFDEGLRGGQRAEPVDRVQRRTCRNRGPAVAGPDSACLPRAPDVMRVIGGCRAAANCCGGGASGRGTAVSSSFWNSKTLMVWGTLSSVSDEVFGGQALDGFAVLVGDGDGLDDELCVDAQGERASAADALRREESIEARKEYSKHSTQLTQRICVSSEPHPQ